MRATLPSKLHAYNYAMNTTGEWLKTWLWLLARPIHTEISCDIHCQNTSCTHVTYTVRTLPVHTETPCDVQSEHFLYTQKYHVIWPLNTVCTEISHDLHCLNTSCTSRNTLWYTLSEHFLFTQKYHVIYTVWTLLYFQKYHVIYTVRTLPVYTEISCDIHWTLTITEISRDIHCVHFLDAQKYHVMYTVWTLRVHTETPCDVHCLNTSCTHRNTMWCTLSEHFLYTQKHHVMYTVWTLPVHTETPRDVHCLNTSCTHRNTTWYACLNTYCTSAKWQTLTSSVFTSCIGFEATKPHCRLQSTFCRQGVFKLQNHNVIYNQHSAD